MSNNPTPNEDNTNVDANQIDNQPLPDTTLLSNQNQDANLPQAPIKKEQPPVATATSPSAIETNVPLTTGNTETWAWITNHKKVAGPLLIIILLFLTAGTASIWLMLQSQESIGNHTAANNIVVSLAKNTTPSNSQTSATLIGFVSEILQLWAYTQNMHVNITVQDNTLNTKSIRPSIMVHEFPKQTPATFAGTLSLPLMYTGSIAISAKDSDATLTKNKRITFGTLSNSNDITFQKLETFKNGIIMTYDTVSHLLADFNNHYLDAMIIPYYLLPTIVHQIKGAQYNNIPITPIGEEYIRVQVNHNTHNAHLIISSFNKFITTLLNTGKLRSLMEKWNLEHLFSILSQAITAEDQIDV